jgi:UDP-N-acetylmuramate dehydrogenase
VIPRAARLDLEEALGDRIRFGVPMARHTSLGVGGPADALATPGAREDLARLLAICTRHGIPHQVIGSGFNTLVLDGGLDGVTIQLGKLRRIDERPGGAIRADAGVSHGHITRFCVERGFAGLEFGAGIPGNVGGWIATNAGIPGREMKDQVREIEVMSSTGRSLRRLPRRQLRFVYRALRGLAPGSLILSALFGIALSTPAEVRAEVDRVLAGRASTQPLDVPTCGSVFKNPPGDFAGRLIEAAGLKGRRIGAAQISPVHANFIANLGGASAADVLALIETARSSVEQQTGIRLEPEVRIIGRRA